MVGREPKSGKPKPGETPATSVHGDKLDLPSPMPGMSGDNVDILNVAQGDEPFSPPPVPGGGKTPSGKDD